MNVRQSVLSSSILAIALVACGSSTTTKTAPAAGPVKVATAKAPANAPKPTKSTGKKSGANVTKNASSAAPTEATCDVSEAGLGVCADTFAIFCGEDGNVYALDCAEAFGATCGAIEDELDCVVTQEQ